MACVVHLGVAGIVVLRALLGDAEDAAGTIFQHPSTLFGAELIMAACVGGGNLWWDLAEGHEMFLGAKAKQECTLFGSGCLLSNPLRFF